MLLQQAFSSSEIAGYKEAAYPPQIATYKFKSITDNDSICVQAEKQAPMRLPARALLCGHAASGFAHSRRIYIRQEFVWRRCQHNSCATI